MTRDLDSLLRTAVTSTPVDTAEVLHRARTLRRRRATGRAIATLAVLAVAGIGVNAAFDRGPAAPVVGTDRDEVEGPAVGTEPLEVEGPVFGTVEVLDAPAPVLPAQVVDASVPLLRVDVEVDEVPPLPDLIDPSARGVAEWWVEAVGPDGTIAATSNRSRLHVEGPRGSSTHDLGATIAIVVVLPGGDVLAALSDGFEAPIDRLVHVVDGNATTLPLAATLARGSGREPLVVFDGLVVIQDEDRVRVAAPTDLGGWRALDVWTAEAGVISDAAVVDVAPADAVGWGGVDLGPFGVHSRVAVSDGPVLEIRRSDRSDAAPPIDRVWRDHVVNGRRVEALYWDDEGDFSIIGVVGPGTEGAAIPVRLPKRWPSGMYPLLSVDGAVWLRVHPGTGVLRIVPPGGLP